MTKPRSFPQARRGSVMTKLIGVLTSRKLWACLAACAVSLQAGQAWGVVAAISAYILGTGVEDGLSRIGTNK